MSLLWLAIVALATVKLIETAKEIVPWPIRPWPKTVASIVIPIALSAWLCDDVRSTILQGLGAAGLALVLHEVRATVSYIGDRAKVDVITQARARSRL